MEIHEYVLIIISLAQTLLLFNYYYLNCFALVTLTLNYYLFSASEILVINMFSFLELFSKSLNLSHMVSISLHFGSAF